MAILWNYSMGKNVNFALSWKKFTFYFLVFSYFTYNGVSPLCKSLENIYKQDSTSNTKFNRLLARHEQQRELERTKLSAKLSDRRPYTEKSYVSDNIKVYSLVKRNNSNNIDLYMNNYKHRYGKKKGLSKLDCYYENKVFKKFCDISDIGKKMKYDEKRSKRFFFKKYGLGLILFALIPALGLIFPMLFGISGSKISSILGPCPIDNHFSKSTKKHKNETHTDCQYNWLYKNEELINNVSYVPLIFSFIMIIIVISVVFYILIKLIKYEQLKSGKNKMNVKEYYRFCKDIF